ncbi:hypothetical protein BOTCAL_0298g00040 [Botryotinia calthae]|uniref:F-box domain-containing protein n=1 Tax=Botryotinia calthae TaxID=38488 RepID=A0A4Y8CX73_9HELO|nr:hypothetical protein BOTCAL_0298g00040 [Botryotinia calthae]
MPKSKDKPSRADRLRRDTAHVESHTGLKIVKGSLLVITINNDWQLQAQNRGDNSLLSRLPAYLQDARRIRIEMFCRYPRIRQAREDTIQKIELLTRMRELLNKSKIIDRLEVFFHTGQEKLDRYIPQLRAVIPLYNLNFRNWMLHCYWGRGLNTIEVKRDSELERKIISHPWLEFLHRRLLIIKLDHTKKCKLRKGIKYEDECEELKESFFIILPLFLSQAMDIHIEVRPLKRKYLLVRMFDDRKMMIDKMVLLINGYRNVRKVKVAFPVDGYTSDYSNFASCFLGLRPTWRSFAVLDEENRREIPVGSLAKRRIEELRKSNNSGTSSAGNRLTNLPGEIFNIIIAHLPPISANSLRACNKLLESLIDPPRL